MKSVSTILYTNTRMTISFFMYLPDVTLQNQTYNVTMSPCLFIRKKRQQSQSFDKKIIQFKVTSRNIYNLVANINVAVKWFYQDEFKDLFGYNERNELMLNPKYRQINVKTKLEKDQDQYIQIYPALVQLPDIITEQDKEGYIFIINHMDNAFYLHREELECILGILKDFSFVNMSNLILTSILCAKEINELNDGSKINNEKYSFNESKNIWVKEKKDLRMT